MKNEFPIFSRTIHGKPLTYLDNAASTQKPLAVIEAMDDCYRHHYSNIHRGVHHLSQQLSARYDAVRAQAARFDADELHGRIIHECAKNSYRITSAAYAS